MKEEPSSAIGRMQPLNLDTAICIYIYSISAIFVALSLMCASNSLVPGCYLF